MDFQKEIEQVIETVKELLNFDDEKIVQMTPAVKDALVQAFSAPEIEKQAADFVAQGMNAGRSLIEMLTEMNNLRNYFKELLENLKATYANSEAKINLVDVINETIGLYIDYIQYQITMNSKVEVEFECVHPNAKQPTYAHEGDQGADVYAVEDTIIEPHTYGNLISTGLKLKIPDGWAVAIRPRSGMSKNTTLRISNAPATIDTKYVGVVGILFDNIGGEPVKINAGDRIAQFILEQNHQAAFTKVDHIDINTDRGTGGFGSSGTN